MAFLFNLRTENKIRNSLASGCSMCPLSDRRNLSLEPTGSDSPILYFCGEAPGETETRTGIQFTGASGQKLRRVLYSIVDTEFERKYIRWNNTVKCRPPDNRTPTRIEVDCCKQYLIEDIKNTRPIVIVTFGAVATEAFLGIDDLFMLSGRFFLTQIGDSFYYVYPMYHPAFLLRHGDSEKLYDSFFEACFRKLFEELPYLERVEKEDIFSGIEIVKSEREAVRHLSTMEGEFIAVDIETDKLRPFDGGKIISVAVSNGIKTVCFPFFPSFLSFLKKKKVIAHNLKFELEWFLYFYGHEVLKIEWHDSMIQAYILDYRRSDKYSKNRGSFNLDFLVFANFGFDLKKLSPNVRKNGIKEFTTDVARYNSLDAKYTYKLFMKQLRRLSKDQLDLYSKTVDVTKSIVMCQSKGLIFDYDFCKGLERKYSEALSEIEKKIFELDCVREFEGRYNMKFDILSPKHLSIVFNEIMKEDLKKTKKGNLSTDSEVISTLAKKGNELASYLLEYRYFYKLKSVYIDNALALNLNNRLYTNYNVCFTATGRLSSGLSDVSKENSLNFQNFPKNDEVRNIIIAPKDHWFVAFDYSQLEVRVVAMLSKDERLCSEIEKGIDIHKQVVDDFFTISPKLKDRLDPKSFRDAVKSFLVFGSIYGSSKDSVIRRFKLEYDISESITSQVYDIFWERYGGIRKWQRELIEFYMKNGYIESPSKRRWFAPLSVKQIVNYIIQSVASFDICACSGARLTKKAIEEKKPYLQFIMNIHDDLSFYIPESKLEEAIVEIGEEMTRKVYDWQIVPLKVKVSIGKKWGELTELTEISTKLS